MQPAVDAFDEAVLTRLCECGACGSAPVLRARPKSAFEVKFGSLIVADARHPAMRAKEVIERAGHRNRTLRWRRRATDRLLCHRRPR